MSGRSFSLNFLFALFSLFKSNKWLKTKTFRYLHLSKKFHVFFSGLEYELVSVPDTVQYKWTTTKEDYVIIGVQASEEARIVLTETYWNTNNSYTVILGHLSNQQSVIQNGSSADELIEETVGILSPDEIRYFWMSWQGQVQCFLVKSEVYIIFTEIIFEFRSSMNKLVYSSARS